MVQNKIYIYGKHAVSEAIVNSPDAIELVSFTSYFDDEALKKVIEAGAGKAGIKIGTFEPNKPPKDFDVSATHQGVIALISLDKLMKPFKEFLAGLKVGTDTSLVILGEIQDPQNVGAVIRSASAFGLGAVLIPEHNQAPITGTVVKVSAGQAFRIPLVSVGNINNAVRDLKAKGFWIYGLDETATTSIVDEKFDAPTVFILGNEAKGLREKTRELCDILLSIPMSPRCESLNAAASAAVAFYAWGAKRDVNGIK